MCIYSKSKFTISEYFEIGDGNQQFVVLHENILLQ